MNWVYSKIKNTWIYWRHRISYFSLYDRFLFQVIGPMLDAIERVSQTAISTLQTSADKGFTHECQDEFRTLEVSNLFNINLIKYKENYCIVVYDYVILLNCIAQ